jgi:hypothetical protein
MKNAIRKTYDLCARHPRLLAGLGLALSIAFIAASSARGDTSASLAKPALGFMAWAALSWYVAEHSDGELDQLIGVVGLLLLILASAAGVVAVSLGL